MKFSSAIILTLTLAFASTGLALELDEARKTGKVKELPTGYLEAAEESDVVIRFVENINKKRKAHYEKVAKKNNTSIELVSKKAAEKIKAKMQK